MDIVPTSRPTDRHSLSSFLASLALDPSLRDQLEITLRNTLEQEKLAALREFAYGASHEINNPLANIATRAQTLLLDERHPERRRQLATIVSQAMRAHEMIADLMLFAKPPPIAYGRVVIAELFDGLSTRHYESLREQECQLTFHVDPRDLTIEADAIQLAVALDALVNNSSEAIGPGGKIDILATREPDHVAISVTDDGPGIPTVIRPHIFEPFFSGREAGRGLGFGLCRVWRIVTDHGGKIDIQSPPEGGCRFVLQLPLHPAGQKKMDGGFDAARFAS